MKKLNQLRSCLDRVRCIHWSDRNIRGLTQDSRLVEPGWLFVACREAHGDGNDYVADAVRNGACAIVVERPVAVSESVVQLVVGD